MRRAGGREMGAVRVDLALGFGALASTVPSEKQWLGRNQSAAWVGWPPPVDPSGAVGSGPLGGLGLHSQGTYLGRPCAEWPCNDCAPNPSRWDVSA